jgi:hypothetical protein
MITIFVDGTEFGISYLKKSGDDIVEITRYCLENWELGQLFGGN